MRKSLVLFVCVAFLCTVAMSCDVRINGGPPTTPTILTPTPTPTPPALPVISSFTTDNAVLVLGQSTSLRWSASGTCRIDPGVGDVQNAGFTPITPASTTTYTLSCSNGIQTVTRQLTITVK